VTPSLKEVIEGIRIGYKYKTITFEGKNDVTAW